VIYFKKINSQHSTVLSWHFTTARARTLKTINIGHVATKNRTLSALKAFRHHAMCAVAVSGYKQK